MPRKQDTISSVSIDEYDINNPTFDSIRDSLVQTFNIEKNMIPLKENTEMIEEATSSNYLSAFSHSRINSLAIQMERRDSIRNMENLRKVHQAKLKLQSDMLNKVAESMTDKRIELLRKMFKMEMAEFIKQYDNLIEIINRQVNNENIRECFLIEQENVLTQRKLLINLIKEHNKTFTIHEDNIYFSDSNYSSKLKKDKVENQPIVVEKPIMISEKDKELRDNDFEAMKTFSKNLIDEQTELFEQIGVKDREIGRLNEFNQECELKIQQFQEQINLINHKHEQEMTQIKAFYNNNSQISEDGLNDVIKQKDELIKILTRKLKEDSTGKTLPIEDPVRTARETILKIDKSVQTDDIDLKEGENTRANSTQKKIHQK